MSALFSRPPNRSVPTSPSLNDPAINAARDATAQTAASSYGRAATIATSGQGVQMPATVAKKTLLGGTGG